MLNWILWPVLELCLCDDEPPLRSLGSEAQWSPLCVSAGLRHAWIVGGKGWALPVWDSPAPHSCSKGPCVEGWLLGCAFEGIVKGLLFQLGPQLICARTDE